MSYVNDIVTPFCVNSVKRQSELTKMLVTNKWHETIFSESVEIDYDKFKVPFTSLYDGARSIRAFKPEIDHLYEFFNNYGAIDFSKLASIKFTFQNTNDITSISIKYLTESFPAELTKKLNKMLNYDIEFKDVYEYYNDPTNQRAIHNRIYTSSLPDFIKLSRIPTWNRGICYQMDQNSVRNTVLPFLVELLDVKLGGSKDGMRVFNRSRFEDIIKSTKDAYTILFEKIDACYDAVIEGVKSYGSFSIISTGQINSLFGLIYSIILDTETRVVALLLRMVRAYIANIKELNEAMSQLSWKDGISSEAFTEEYDDDVRGNALNISMTNNAGLLDTAEELITSIRNLTNIKNEDIARNAEKYTTANPHLVKIFGRKTVADISMYRSSVNALNLIRSRIIQFASTIKKGNLASADSLDEILRDCDLPFDASAMFDTIFEGYIPASMSPARASVILCELIVFTSSVKAAAEVFNFIGEQLSDTLTYLSNNVNGSALVNADSAQDWIRNAINALGIANEGLGLAYRKRLVSLADLLPAPNRYKTKHIVLDKEYLPLHPQDEPECLVEYEEGWAEEEINSLNQYYTNLYRKKLRGEVILEAGENNQQQQNNTGNAGANTDQGKQSTAPVVKDNTGTTNTNQDNQNSTDGNNNNNTNQENKETGKIVGRIQQLIRTMIEKIQQLAQNGSKEKNLKFLADNKDFLTQRNYVNTSVEMLPYRRESNYVEMMKKCINKAANIDAGTLKSTDENGIRNAIFGGINAPVTSEGLEADLVRGFKVGNKELKMTTVADGNLKTAVPGMISYCEKYLNSFADSLKGLENDIKQLSSLDNKKSSEQNDKTNENVNLVSSQLATGLKAMRYAARDRFNDYMKILSALAQSNKTAKANKSDQNTNAQNTNTEDTTQQ